MYRYILAVSLIWVLINPIFSEELNINNKVILYPEEIELLENTIAKSPSNFDLKYQLAILYLEWGKDVPARKDFALSKALDINNELLIVRPDSLRNLYLKIKIYLLNKDKENILKACDELLKYYPDNLNTLNLAYNTAKKLNKDYIDYVKKILEIDPLNKEANEEWRIYKYKLSHKKKKTEVKHQKRAVTNVKSVKKPVVNRFAPVKSGKGIYGFKKGSNYSFILEILNGEKPMVKGEYSIKISNIAGNTADAEINFNGTEPATLPKKFNISLPLNGSFSTVSKNIKDSLIQYIVLPLPNVDITKISGKQTFKSNMFIPVINANSPIDIEYTFKKEQDGNIGADVYLKADKLTGETGSGEVEGECVLVIDKNDLVIKSFEGSIWISGLKEGEEIEINIKVKRKG